VTADAATETRKSSSAPAAEVREVGWDAVDFGLEHLLFVGLADGGQKAPFLDSRARIVLARILRSSLSDHEPTYALSSRIRSS
jgi:hypothetical protein